MGGHPVALVDATAMAEPDGVEMARIPALAHAEAAAMATVELERFLALLAGLGPDDWTRPTVCDLWNVREMVAHVAGAAASYARWSEFRHQWNPLAFRRHQRAGFGVLAAVNQLQISDRTRAAPGPEPGWRHD